MGSLCSRRAAGTKGTTSARWPAASAGPALVHSCPGMPGRGTAPVRTAPACRHHRQVGCIRPYVLRSACGCTAEVPPQALLEQSAQWPSAPAPSGCASTLPCKLRLPPQATMQTAGAWIHPHGAHAARHGAVTCRWAHAAIRTACVGRTRLAEAFPQASMRERDYMGPRPGVHACTGGYCPSLDDVCSRRG